MYIEILTPEKKLFAGEAKLIKLPGTQGSFEILDRHSPLMSSLSKGTIKVIEPDGNKLFFEISGGIIETSENKVTVIAD